MSGNVARRRLSRSAEETAALAPSYRRRLESEADALVGLQPAVR